MLNRPDIKTQNILRELKESDCQKVKVAITDLDGILRSKYLEKEKFINSTENGFGFCNMIFAWDSNSVDSGYLDALAKIDLQTYRRTPWEKEIPFFLCDFEDTRGNLLPICSRQLLKKTIQKANQKGYDAQFAFEFEWFNFKESPKSIAEKNYSSPDAISPGMFGYSILRSSVNQPFLNTLLDELKLFNVPLEGLHTEIAPGVLEASLAATDALEAADRATLFKSAAKEIAYRFGILPSFMAKWNSQLPGCSGHIHQSLWDNNSNRNLFYSENDSFKMSSILKNYLAGQLLCLPEILPMFAPTVNSYKRLVDGFWAPTHATWSIDNRTSAFRVIPSSSQLTRIEGRVPGADANPYLVIAASLASGLYGIEKNLELHESSLNKTFCHEHKPRKLPRNLFEATLQMSNSQIARDLFGEEFVDHFVKTRIWEWEQFQESVTQWELQRYFEAI